MLWLFVLLMGAAQIVYAVVELAGRDGKFNLTTWVVAGLAFALSEAIRRNNQQQPEEKLLRSNRKHPLEG